MNEALVDEAAVRDGMPEMRLSRADNYQQKGWVELIQAEPGRITAHVTGETGNIYVVEFGARDASDCRCSCPDFAENGLRCKHVAATAKQVALTDPDDLRKIRQRLERLRDQLDMEGVDDPDADVDRARRDPALLKALEGGPAD
ncbi:putative Zn finger protein [Caulobacter ginsengisoli]|uniref:Zn finger protein n=1 Tax=Caulobacter ginsengisoli TaxID=400775 RepID=A0ABU0IXU2_9CAUL|nr:SWIM zinc finger family protein [Caulobacter ginsengisoli]MDQ0466824.1 putative Zn finger protein [Caulobacter ginsengisoli]